MQDTLDGCTSENVEQMQAAMQMILQRHSQSYPHDYQWNWQVLDADMTGRPCGKKANFASKGYFAKQRNRRGRQEGYVIATWYEEIIVEQLFAGTTQLNKALPGLIETAEQVWHWMNANEGPFCGSTPGVGVLKTSIGFCGAIRCTPRIIPACGLKPWPKVSASGSSIQTRAVARWAG